MAVRCQPRGSASASALRAAWSARRSRPSASSSAAPRPRQPSRSASRSLSTAIAAAPSSCSAATSRRPCANSAAPWWKSVSARSASPSRPGPAVEQQRRRLLPREREVAARRARAAARASRPASPSSSLTAASRASAPGRVAEREPRRRCRHREPGVVGALGDRGDRIGGDDVEQQLEPVVGDQRRGGAHAARRRARAASPRGRARRRRATRRRARAAPARGRGARAAGARAAALRTARGSGTTCGDGRAGRGTRRCARAARARARRRRRRSARRRARRRRGRRCSCAAAARASPRAARPAPRRSGSRRWRDRRRRTRRRTRRGWPRRAATARRAAGRRPSPPCARAGARRASGRSESPSSSSSAVASSSVNARSAARSSRRRPDSRRRVERQLGVGAGRRHHVQRVAAMDEQLAERGERRAAQQVEVVEHEHRALRRAGQRVGEPQRDVVVERDVLAGRSASHTSAHSRRESEWQAPSVSHAAPLLRRPAAQQHGLAPAGRRLHQGERAGRARRRAQPEAADARSWPREPAGRTSGRPRALLTAVKPTGPAGHGQWRAPVCTARARTRARGCRAPVRTRLRSRDRRRQPPHLDQLEPERLDAVEQPVQPGLVGHRPVQDGLGRRDVRVHSLERSRGPRH